MSIKSVLAMLAVLLTTACTEKGDVTSDPKKVLNEYISRSFSVRSPTEKQQLVDLLTRDAKNRLSAWSEEQFRQAFVDNKRQFVKLVFTETKNVSAEEASITYELTYIQEHAPGRDDPGKGNDAKITQKKLAQIVREQGKWLISDVRNIKEMVEYRNEMSLP